MDDSGGYSRKTVAVATIMVVAVVTVTVCGVSEIIVAVTFEIEVGMTVLHDELVEIPGYSENLCVERTP